MHATSLRQVGERELKRVEAREELECQITYPLNSIGTYSGGEGGGYTDAAIYLINIH